MQAYEGVEPFVFVSYAHVDKEQVLPILEVLARVGLRIWYDEGIFSGDDWADKLEQRLTDCDRVLAFISQGYIDSRNCRDEMGFALNEGIPVHLVRLDEAPYAHGLKLRLGAMNYVLYNGDTSALVTTLLSDGDLQGCKGQPVIAHQFWRPPNSWFGQSQTKEEQEALAQRLAERWGPERPTYSEGSYPERWALNSCHNHQLFGDMRRFVSIRRKGAKRWERGATLVPGETYEVRIVYRIDGDPHRNAAGTAIADKVKLSTYVPECVFPQRSGVVRAAFHAAWPQPGPLAPEDEVWASVDLYVHDQPVFLSFVLGSARICNQGKLDGKVLGTQLFGDTGIYLGFNRISGTIPSGDEFAGEVRFELRAWSHQGDCAVRRLARVGDGEYAAGMLEVTSGDLVGFRTEFANQSDTDLTRVTFKDLLPSGLQVVPSSTHLVDGDGNDRLLGDGIGECGYNAGLCGQGVSAQVEYQIRIPVSEHPCNYFTRSDVIHDGGRRFSSLLLHAAGTSKDDPRLVADPEHDPRFAAWLAQADRGGGWGPQRELFTMKAPASYATFNSIRDNNVLGDERNFVRVCRRGSHGTFVNRLQVVPGYLYEVYIGYDNSASPGAGEAGVAHDVRISSVFPSRIEAMSCARVSAVVSARDTNPPEVWSHSVFWAAEPVVLRYVPESARIYNGRHKGLPLPGVDLFGKDGALIGADALDGVISSADRDASGHIIYLLSAEEG